MQALIQQLENGNVTWLTGAIFCLGAIALGALGGALGGVLVGGRHIGYGLSAMMGTFFGPIAALPGILVALVLVVLLRG